MARRFVKLANVTVQGKGWTVIGRNSAGCYVLRHVSGLRMVVATKHVALEAEKVSANG